MASTTSKGPASKPSSYSGGHDHKMRILDRRPFPGPREGRFHGPGRRVWPRGTPKPKNQRDTSPQKGNPLCGMPLYLDSPLDPRRWRIAIVWSMPPKQTKQICSSILPSFFLHAEGSGGTDNGIIFVDLCSSFQAGAVGHAPGPNFGRKPTQNQEQTIIYVYIYI